MRVLLCYRRRCRYWISFDDAGEAGGVDLEGRRRYAVILATAFQVLQAAHLGVEARDEAVLLFLFGSEGGVPVREGGDDAGVGEGLGFEGGEVVAGWHVLLRMGRS